MSHIKLDYGFATGKGAKRDINRDAVYTQVINGDGALSIPTIGLFMVCSGMGATDDAVAAVQIAIKTIASALNQFISSDIFDSTILPDDQTILSAIIASVGQANLRILEAEGYGGASITVALTVNDQVYIGHAGETAIAIIDASEITRFTKIHLFSEKLVELGHMTREELQNAHIRDALYKALGQIDDLEIDTLHTTFPEKTGLLLFSRGILPNMIPDELFPLKHSTIAQSKNPQDACDKLIELAKEKIYASENWNMSVIFVSNGFPFQPCS